MSLLNGVSSHDDGTASELAFKKTFRVGIQNQFLYTPEIIKWMGTPTTGNRTLDRQLRNNFVEIMATPIACVEYYLMGAPISFRNAAIPNQILTILRQHVNNWDYIGRNFYNVEMPPMEELDEISEFCELIVRYAAAGKKRDNAWLLQGRSQRNDGMSGLSLPAIGGRRRAAGSSAMEETKTGTDARAEKMMNFRRSFAKQQKSEGK
jgi:hypothetical protein